MEYEELLTSHQILLPFLLQYNEGALFFRSGIDETMLWCDPNLDCEDCCLYCFKKCHVEGMPSSASAKEMSSHFDSLVLVCKETNPEEFI